MGETTGVELHLMFRLKDSVGDGFTQLWLGQGTSIQEYDWAPVVQEGAHKNVTFRRVQPLTENLMLNASIGKSWNKTTVASYLRRHRERRCVL